MRKKVVKKKVEKRTDRKKVVKGKVTKRSGKKENGKPLPYLSAFMSIWGSKM